MGIKKTRIGYHIADGGGVYKVTSANKLISYYYCDFCQSSSSSSNLTMSDVASDITGFADSIPPSGDIPGTDDDYKGLYNQLTSSLKTKYLPTVSGWNNNPFTRKHLIESTLASIPPASSTDVAVADYTTFTTDSILSVSYSLTGDSTVTLSTLDLIEGRRLVIKDTGGNATEYNITVRSQNNELLDDALTLVLYTDYGSVGIYSDGAAWFIY